MPVKCSVFHGLEEEVIIIPVEIPSPTKTIVLYQMSPPAVNDAPPAALVDAPGILQDMLFGTGSSTYHTVNADIGAHTTHHETLNLVPARGETPPHALAPIADMCADDDMCGAPIRAFRDCLDNYGSDNRRCRYYVDILAECNRKCKPDLIFSYGDDLEDELPQLIDPETMDVYD